MPNRSIAAGVAAASDGKRFAISDGIRHDFSPFTEVRELKHANRAVPQNGFGILEDFSQLLSGSIADIRDLLVFFHVVNGFQSRWCGFGELGGNANIGRNRDIASGQQTFCFVNQSASYRDLPTLWP